MGLNHILISLYIVMNILSWTQEAANNQRVCFKQGNLGPSRKHHSLSMLWNPGISIYLKHVPQLPYKKPIKIVQDSCYQQLNYWPQVFLPKTQLVFQLNVIKDISWQRHSIMWHSSLNWIKDNPKWKSVFRGEPKPFSRTKVSLKYWNQAPHIFLLWSHTHKQ